MDAKMGGKKGPRGEGKEYSLVTVIDIEVSRLAIGFQKVCIIRLPQ